MITPSIISKGMIHLNSESSNSSLVAGDILKGKVESVGSGKSVAIRLKGHLFKAELPQDLKVGKEYLFEVKSIFPKILLSLASSGTSLTLTTDTDKISKLGVSIFSLLGKISIFAAEGGSSHSVASKTFLLSFLNLFYSGSGAESLKKLVALFKGEHIDDNGFDINLKKVLEKLLLSVKGENNSAVNLLKNEIDSLLKNIESFRHSSGDHYPIPFLFDEEAGIASLYYDQEQKGQKNGDENNFFTLNLELSGLGEVETVVRMTEQGLIILFRVASEASSSAIIDNIPMLKESMKSVGLDVSHVEAVVIEKRSDYNEFDQKYDFIGGVDLKV